MDNLLISVDKCGNIVDKLAKLEDKKDRCQEKDHRQGAADPQNVHQGVVLILAVIIHRQQIPSHLQ